ncbi:hypothetical protein LUCX_323 [Xanthomonas phage vB_XciM_LucasX]|nr:hypothetical protein LUCX_323 [Xanthomonas phage vB_XciM_LucasX]
MLNNLRDASETISMEAAGGTAMDKAAERIPAFLSSASEFLAKNIFAPIASVFGAKDLGWLALRIQHKPFSELRGTQLVAPQGFKGTLAEYGQALVAMVESISDLEKDVLVPYATWLAQRIAEPESLKSISGSLRIPGLDAPKLDSLKKRLDTFFPDKVDERDPIYSELFRRQADWNELNQLSKKLQTLYADGRYEKVQKKVPEIVDLLDVLSVRVSEHKEEFQFSSVAMEQLSKVTFQIAELVEFYGVVRHRVDEYLKTINQNVEIVKPLV